MHTYQGVKHKDVIVIGLRVFHHDVEQGIECVLQKLHGNKAVGQWKNTPRPVYALMQRKAQIFTSDLDNLFSINDFKFLQVFFQEFGSSPPFKEPQQAH